MLELFPDSARIDADALAVGGVSAEELADRFGTPLVVYCEETIRRRARALRAAAGAQGRVFYGTKAFPNVAVLRLLREEGVGADVASAGELAFARRAGLSRSRARRAREQQGRRAAPRGRGGGRAGRARRARRAALAAAAGVQARARPRHARCRRRHARGDRDRASRLEVRPAAGARRASPSPTALASGLDVLGLHVHVGSQLPDFTAQAETISRLAAFAAACRDELGWEARVADLGGGFGIRHHPDDDVPEAAELARVAAATARDVVRRGGTPRAGGLARAGTVPRRAGQE